MPWYSFFTQYILFHISQDNRNLMSFVKLQFLIVVLCRVMCTCQLTAHRLCLFSVTSSVVGFQRSSRWVRIDNLTRSSLHSSQIGPFAYMYVSKSFTLATLAPGLSSPFSFHIFSILFFGKCFACFGNPWMLTLPPLDCFISHQLLILNFFSEHFITWPWWTMMNA